MKAKNDFIEWTVCQLFFASMDIVSSSTRQTGAMSLHMFTCKKGNVRQKFWLQPGMLASNDRFANHELNKIQKLVEHNQINLVQKWYEFPDD